MANFWDNLDSKELKLFLPVKAIQLSGKPNRAARAIADDLVAKNLLKTKKVAPHRRAKKKMAAKGTIPSPTVKASAGPPAKPKTIPIYEDAWTKVMDWLHWLVCSDDPKAEKARKRLNVTTSNGTAALIAEVVAQLMQATSLSVFMVQPFVAYLLFELSHYGKAKFCKDFAASSPN